MIRTVVIDTPGRAKYSSVPTVVDNIRFHSQAEARFYRTLKMREAVGEISQLECQVRYPIMIGDAHICTYIADFRYYDEGEGAWHTVDVKGKMTNESRIKIALAQALYLFTVEIVRSKDT